MSNPKMKPEVKEAWVNALRSGVYKQGTRTLHQSNEDGPDTFCCLGVLCDLAYREGVVQREEVDAFEGLRYAYGNDDWANGGMPPQEVVDWAFEGPEGQVNEAYLGHLGTKYSTTEDADVYNNIWLPTLNDTKHLSFESIARVIEMEDI